MEALRLLKNCRIRGHAATVGDSIADARATKTIVAAAVSPHLSDGEDESYFDLEFPQTGEEDEISSSNGEEFSDDEHDEEDLKFALLSNECADDGNLKLSLSRNSVRVESSGILLEKNLEDNSKSPVSSLKSPSKFRFLLLKLKKPKSGNGILEKAENMEKKEDDDQIQEKQGKSSNNFFTVNFKAEEVKLTLVSLFTRDNCSKEKNGKFDDVEYSDSSERKLTKEMVQKYLKMVKPLYFQLTKNYVGRLKLSGHLSFPKGGGADPLPCSTAEKGAEVVVEVAAGKTKEKQGNNNLQAGLKIVGKHLGKSRSDSATVAVVAPPGKMVSGRRDDSMLQMQDGIQGAILHCKKSLDSSKSSDEESSSILYPSVSDTEKSVPVPTV